MKAVFREHYRNSETYADRIYVGKRTFAVADGMGVGKGPVRAAETAISVIRKLDPLCSLEDMERAMKSANELVMKETAQLGDREVSGTTLSVISFCEDGYVLGHIGDSRIYRFSEGEVHLLTEEHVTEVNGKKLVSVLGMEWNPRYQISEGTYSKGDVFVLMSDGFVDAVQDGVLESIFSSDPEIFAKDLYEAFLSSGSDHDMSFIIIATD